MKTIIVRSSAFLLLSQILSVSVGYSQTFLSTINKPVVEVRTEDTSSLLPAIPEYLLYQKRFQADDLFRYYDQSWRNAFSPINQKKLLMYLSEDLLKPSNFSDDKIQFIVDTRSCAQQMRTAFKMLDKNHETPKKFNHFMVVFGRYKDSLKSYQQGIEFGKSQEELLAIAEVIRGYAQEISDLMSKNDYSEVGKKFEAGSFKDQKVYIDESLTLLEKLAFPNVALSENEQHWIPSDDFHTIRKIFRDFYYYFSSLKQLYGGVEYDLIIELLNKTQKSMGEKNDQLTQDLITDREMYLASKLPVSQKMARTASQLLSVFGRGNNYYLRIPIKKVIQCSKLFSEEVIR